MRTESPHLQETCEPVVGVLSVGASGTCAWGGQRGLLRRDGRQDTAWGEQVEASTAYHSVHVPRPDKGGGDAEWTPGCGAELGRQATCQWAREASPFGL